MNSDRSVLLLSKNLLAPDLLIRFGTSRLFKGAVFVRMPAVFAQCAYSGTQVLRLMQILFLPRIIQDLLQNVPEKNEIDIPANGSVYLISIVI